MSSHSVKLTKAIKDLIAFREMAKEGPDSEYNRGVHNGIELTLALLQGRDPKYAKPATQPADPTP